MDVVRLAVFTGTKSDLDLSKSKPKAADNPVYSTGRTGMEQH